MDSVNYMQRVGHSSCIRCDFETSDEMPFKEQDAAMMAHLAEKHPNWMTDGVTMQERPSDWKPLTTYQEGDVVTPFGTISKAGSTVHKVGCLCGFCKMGDTKGSSSMSWSNSQ